MNFPIDSSSIFVHTMDKSWMNALKWSSQYIEGVKNFMKLIEEKFLAMHAAELIIDFTQMSNMYFPFLL